MRVPLVPTYYRWNVSRRGRGACDGKLPRKYLRASTSESKRDEIGRNRECFFFLHRLVVGAGKTCGPDTILCEVYSLGVVESAPGPHGDEASAPHSWGKVVSY